MRSDTAIPSAQQRPPAAAARLAAWVAGLSLDDLPDSVTEAAKLHLLDAVGGGLAALALGEMGAPAAVADELGGQPRATVIGRRGRRPETLAALVNGSLVHALDYDDIHSQTVIHSSAVVAPVVLACSEAFNASGSDALVAAVVGYEISARIGLAGAGRFLVRGLHPTSVCGVFGAAAAAAKLRGSAEAQILDGLGIAGSLASGLLECLSDGTRTKPLHAGFAAQAGILAAALAAHGAEGPAGVIDGRFGLLPAYLGNDYDLGEVTDGLGERWETLSISFKPYPACRYTHSCLEALAALMATGANADDVVEIACQVHGDEARKVVVEPLERKRAPQTTYEAKFSLPYCLAHLLLKRSLDIASFAAEAISDREVLNLAGQVSCLIKPLSGGNEFSGAVTLLLADSRRLERTVLFPKGSRENPMSTEAIIAKFRANAALALPPPAVEDLIERFSRLERERIVDVVRPLRFARQGATTSGAVANMTGER